MPLLSFVIPCYRSEKTISKVVEEIVNTVSEKSQYDYEIIAVNDSSPDNLMSILRKLAESNKRIKVINLAKNSGRHCALLCGCHFAKGDFVVFLDDDCQCPMDHFWDLLLPIEKENYDVSIAKYPKKKQSLLKNIGSKVNDIVSTKLLKKDKNLKFSNFSVMKNFVKDEIIKYDNPYPYVSGLIIRATERVINVEMEERQRPIGVGNYTLKKSFALWMNNLTAFSIVPLRIAITFGIIFSFIGFVMTIFTIVRKLVNPAIALGYSSLMAVLFFIGGMLMFMMGMIGEYVGRIYMSINKAPQFVIRETINTNKGQN